MTAAVTYNNPGNVSLPISGYTGPGTIVGLSGQPGYASFPTMQDGLNALSARLNSYINNDGLSTISQLNTSYATDPNWGNGVSSISGIGLNTPLDTSNASQMSALQAGIVQQETGMNISNFQSAASSSSGYGGGLINSDGSSAVGYLPGSSSTNSSAAQSVLGSNIKSSPSALSAASGAGKPVNITDISSAGQSAGNTINSGLTQLSKTVNSSTQTAVAAGSNLLSGLLQGSTDLFIRMALVLVAIVVLIGAWMLFSKGGDHGQTVIIPL